MTDEPAREVPTPAAGLKEKPPVRSKYTDPNSDRPDREIRPAQFSEIKPRSVLFPGELVGSSRGSWEIVARADQRTLEQGSPLEIRMYLTGYGVPEWGKLVFYPPQGLLASPDPAQAEVTAHASYKTAHTDLHSTAGPPAGKPVIFAVAETTEVHMPPDGGFFDVPLAYFIPAPQPESASVALWDAKESAAHHVVGETDEAELSPLRFVSHISEKARRGDHTIAFVLTYKTTEGIKTSRYDVELHIQQFWETVLFQVLAGLGSAIVVVSSVLAIVAAYFWR